MGLNSQPSVWNPADGGREVGEGTVAPSSLMATSLTGTSGTSPNVLTYNINTPVVLGADTAGGTTVYSTAPTVTITGGGGSGDEARHPRAV